MVGTLRGLAGCALGYSVGSVPVGLWLGRAARGLDVREHGSGSTGATNVSRVLGPAAGAAVFLLDVGKGAVAVGAARALGTGSAGQAAAGLAAVVGHSWPALAHFRGGKSVATAFGGLIVLSPPGAGAAVAGGMTALLTTRIVSVGSLAAAGSATAGTAAAWALSGPRTGGAQRRCSRAAAFGFTAAATGIIVLRHSPNLRRLLRGEEPRMVLAGRSRADARSVTNA
ncbi:MAG TPA: glycerol-3-phosphate acyltransferase [Candidatus Dormibacteraeota bacterium]|jgi:glycerol-3-phosphate acyltransferase PlsY